LKRVPVDQLIDLYYFTNKSEHFRSLEQSYTMADWDAEDFEPELPAKAVAK
jgi:hypothetical protein